MGSRSIIFNFSAAQNFFEQVISDKIFKFRIFWRAKGTFLRPVFTVSLEKLIFLHLSMEPILMSSVL